MSARGDERWASQPIPDQSRYNHATGQQQDKQQGNDQNKGTRKVVLVALVVNILIALVKFAAGLLSGSSSLLSEGAHSIADTMNEVFLLISLRLSDDAPDRRHPFGYGKDRFFWSFMAAVFIFAAGAVFSVFEGIQKILSAQSHESFLIGYIALAIAFCAEGMSWSFTLREVRKTSREQHRSILQEVRRTHNTTVKLPLLEDTAALIGVVLAAGGLVLTQVTGNHLFDGLGSIAIGVLLAVLAWLIGTDSRDLLLGEGVTKRDELRLREAILSFPEVQRIARFYTMYIGTQNVLLTADIDLDPRLSSREVDEIIHRLDSAIHSTLPDVTETFLEPHIFTRTMTHSSAS